MLTSETGEGRAMLLTVRVSGEYLTLRGRIVRVATDGTPRNLYADDYSVDPLCDVSVSAQADRSDGGRSYAWRIGADTDGMGVTPTAQAIATVATLRAAGRAMLRDDTRYGVAPTFGGWLARVLVALGVPAIIGRTDTWTYSDGAYSILASGDAARIIDESLVRYYRTGEGPEYWR